MSATLHRGRPGDARHDWMKVLFVSYGLLLVTGVIHAFVFDAMFGSVKDVDDGVRRSMLLEILAVEVIDTVIILFVLSLRTTPPPQRQPSRGWKLTIWLASPLILAAMLGVNLGYHWLLRHYTGLPLITDELTARFNLLVLLVVCIQPAVVEEVYFRRFALDSLLSATGIHAAVWLSATMFAFVHVAVLPSIPYLILMGAALAYLRLASGSLILPMILHFVHNLLITLLPS